MGTAYVKENGKRRTRRKSGELKEMWGRRSGRRLLETKEAKDYPQKNNN